MKFIMRLTWRWSKLTNQVQFLWNDESQDWLIDDHLYSAILRSLEQTHCARLWFYTSDKLFIARFYVVFFVVFFEYPPKWCTYSAGMAGATWNCSHLTSTASPAVPRTGQWKSCSPPAVSLANTWPHTSHADKIAWHRSASKCDQLHEMWQWALSVGYNYGWSTSISDHIAET